MFSPNIRSLWSYSNYHILWVISDRGANFMGDVCVEFCGTDQVLTVGFRPQANGIVERVNGEIVRHLQTIINEKNWSNRWSSALPLVQRILNSSVCEPTGYAPIFYSLAYLVNHRKRN